MIGKDKGKQGFPFGNVTIIETRPRSLAVARFESILADLRFALQHSARLRIRPYRRPRPCARHRRQRQHLRLCQRRSAQTVAVPDPRVSLQSSERQRPTPMRHLLSGLSGLEEQQPSLSLVRNLGRRCLSLAQSRRRCSSARGPCLWRILSDPRVTPAIGRLFTSADDTPEARRTVVLPYATWERLFGDEPTFSVNPSRSTTTPTRSSECFPATSSSPRVRLNSGSRSTTSVPAKETARAARLMAWPGSRRCHRFLRAGQHQHDRRPAAKPVSSVQSGAGCTRHALKRFLQRRHSPHPPHPARRLSPSFAHRLRQRRQSAPRPC